MTYLSNGKKKININSKKYCKMGSKYVLFQMAEIVGENKVRLYYANDYAIGKYGGIVEVNAKTGKIRELVSNDNYFPRAYDENMYMDIIYYLRKLHFIGHH